MNRYNLHNTLIYNNSISYPGQQFSVSTAAYTAVHNLPDQVEGRKDTSIDLSFTRETLLPLSILKNNSSLEAIVLYLKDSLGLRFNEISVLLNRNQRTIWATYANAKRKDITTDARNDSQIFIPLDVLCSRNLSILESIVVYLRTTYNLSFNQVSDLLGKNYRTIWTVYRRALKKLDSGMEDGK